MHSAAKRSLCRIGALIQYQPALQPPQVHPEGKYVVDLEPQIDMAKVTPTTRVALRNDSYALHKLLPNKVRVCYCPCRVAGVCAVHVPSSVAPTCVGVWGRAHGRVPCSAVLTRRWNPLAGGPPGVPHDGGKGPRQHI